MHIHSHFFSLFLVLVLGVSLTACDQGSQNFSFEQGSNLTVVGPGTLTLSEGSASGEYYVRAFTIKQDYEWSVSGSAQITQVRRDGEYVDVSFSEPGSYEVTVTTTIDGQQYTGTQTTEVSAP